MIRKTIEGLKNLWRWFPIVWKDRDWDQYYLYKVLNFKFRNMEYLHRNYGHLTDADKVADKLKVCKLLTERLLEDEYHENVFRYHNKKWGEPEFNWGEPDCRLVVNRKFVVTDEDKKQEPKEYRILMNHEQLLRKQDIFYLFKLMNKHIETWWD